MKAIAKTIRITPKKANLIASMIRGKNAIEALEILSFTPKKAAKILYKIVQSALANANNNFKQDKKNLKIQHILVTKGPTLKRGVSVSKGRVYPIAKRTSHITVTLTLDLDKLDKAITNNNTKTINSLDSKKTKKTPPPNTKSNNLN